MSIESGSPRVEHNTEADDLVPESRELAQSLGVTEGELQATAGQSLEELQSETARAVEEYVEPLKVLSRQAEEALRQLDATQDELANTRLSLEEISQQAQELLEKIGEK